MALKYEWEMDFIPQSHSAILYKPRQQPSLINSSYGEACDAHINLFQFSLERADNPITNVEIARTMTTSAVKSLPSSSKKGIEFLDNYRGALMVVLLMIVLFLCIMASKY